MHSADYVVARCPSVRPSVRYTPVLSLNGYTYPKNFFTTILVFLHQTGRNIPTATPPPPNGGVEYKGVWKNHDFQPISRFISQMMQR